MWNVRRSLFAWRWPYVTLCLRRYLFFFTLMLDLHETPSIPAAVSSVIQPIHVTFPNFEINLKLFYLLEVDNYLQYAEMCRWWKGWLYLPLTIKSLVLTIIERFKGVVQKQYNTLTALCHLRQQVMFLMYSKWWSSSVFNYFTMCPKWKYNVFKESLTDKVD